MSTATKVEGVLRELALEVLGALVWGYRDFDSCEDAVQEALLAARSSGRTKACRATRRDGCSRSRRVG